MLLGSISTGMLLTVYFKSLEEDGHSWEVLVDALVLCERIKKSFNASAAGSSINKMPSVVYTHRK